MSLIELIVVVALASIAVAIAVAYSTPWIARESMRSAANDVQSFLQLAKIEAVSRNHDCRFVVDTASGALEVWDSMGTPDISDDVRLHTGALPTSVSIERPDTGSPVTLEQVGGSPSYQTMFASDGLVSAGVGGVFLHGGDGFGRVEVRAAGGVEIQHWNGTGWHAGF
jgi:Tfp pilus assembly protein FimT